MENHPIQDIMANALTKMREIVDSNTIIGKPMVVRDGVTVIPVSKITFGFVSGGSDFATEKQKDLFGGAASSGTSITPVAFLVVQGTSVRLIQLAEGGRTVDRVLNMVPEVIDRVEGFISKGKKEGAKTSFDKADDVINAAKAASEARAAREEREKAE